MFEVLMFLFENYMDGNISLKMDNQTIISELERFGFIRYEIDRALAWLHGLNEFQKTAENAPKITPHAMRFYMPMETEQLGEEGIGFLFYLERMRILDPLTREIVIDRLMVLDNREINLGRIKWVVLMALFNQPDKKSALTVLQEMVLSDAFDVLH